MNGILFLPYAVTVNNCISGRESRKGFVMEGRFYICELCGNIVGLIKNGGGELVCCGQAMKHLEPGSVDAAQEKHVPEAKVEGCRVGVKVGSVPHPMTEDHLIEWVYLQTDLGGQRKILAAGDEPEVCFHLCGDEKPVSVFAYCNLHGLWKADI